MMIGSILTAGARVNRRSAQMRHVMEESVVCLSRDSVGIGEIELRIGHDVTLGSELMSDPSQTNALHRFDPPHATKQGLDLIDQSRVDGIHQAAVDIARRIPGDSKNDDRNCQPRNWIGQWKARSDSQRSRNDGEGCKSIDAGVQAVGNQRCRADATPDANTEERHDLITCEANQTGGYDPADVSQF